MGLALGRGYIGKCGWQHCIRGVKVVSSLGLTRILGCAGPSL